MNISPPVELEYRGLTQALSLYVLFIAQDSIPQNKPATHYISLKQLYLSQFSSKLNSCMTKYVAFFMAHLLRGFKHAFITINGFYGRHKASMQLFCHSTFL
jgi:hypothetical protein